MTSVFEHLAADPARRYIEKVEKVFLLPRSWDKFQKSRTYEAWKREAQRQIRKDQKSGLETLTTYDNRYQLQVRKTQVPGWIDSYRTDDPYNGNRYTNFRSTRSHDMAVQNLLDTVLRYRFEMEKFGSVQGNQTTWSAFLAGRSAYTANQNRRT